VYKVNQENRWRSHVSKSLQGTRLLPRHGPGVPGHFESDRTNQQGDAFWSIAIRALADAEEIHEVTVVCVEVLNYHSSVRDLDRPHLVVGTV
jgi:hypothetical protein